MNVLAEGKHLACNLHEEFCFLDLKNTQVLTLNFVVGIRSVNQGNGQNSDPKHYMYFGFVRFL